MLNHWYFGCCVNLSRRQHEFLLAAMNVLENPEDNYTLLKITCRELERADIWTRAYAFPTALEALRLLNRPNPVVSDLRDLCESFAPFLPSSLQTSFKTASAHISRVEQSDCRIFYPAAFAEQTIGYGELDRERTRLNTPYLDSEVFLPEILLLSFLLACREDARNILENQNVREFVDKAQNEQFGRLPFILASELILRYHRTFSVAELQEGLRRRSHNGVALEADLADIDTRASLFLESTSTLLDTGEWLARELEAFKDLYRNGETSIQDHITLERLGFPTTREALWTHGILCRYWARLKSYTRLDPSLLTSLLSEEWQQVDFRRPLSFKITAYPVYKQALSTLAGQFRLPVRLGLGGPVQTTFSDLTKIVLSPWFPGFNSPKDLNVRKKKWEEYIASSQIMWLRMAICSWVASDMLCGGWETDDAQKKFLGKFIAHCAVRMSGLKTAFGNVRRARQLEEFKDLVEWPRQQEALMMASRDRVMRIGAGLYKNVGPDFFLGDTGAETTIGCIQFVEYGYVQGNESEGPERWKEQLPSLLSRFDIERSGNEFKKANERLMPALLRRYLLSRYEQKSLPQESILKDESLRSKVEEFTQGKTRQSRWLLLLTREKATQRIKQYLPSIMADSSNEDKGTRLRASAVQYLIIQGWIDEIEREKWRDDLLDSLWQVDERIYADRFVKLLLLEALQYPIVTGDEILQRAIAFFILEWGSAHDLNILIDSIFYPGDEEARGKITLANRQVNKALIKALLNYRGMLTDNEEQILGAPNPWHLSLDIMRQEVVDRGLTAVINAAWRDRSNKRENGSGYLIDVMEICDRHMQSQKCQGLQWRSIDLTKRMDPKEVYDTVSGSAGAVMDASNERMLYLHDPLLSPIPGSCQAEPCVNLFTGGQKTHEVFNGAQSRMQVVAVVMEIKIQERISTLKLNIGTNRFWVLSKMPSIHARRIKPGDCGKIEIEKDARGRWKYRSGSWQPFPFAMPDYAMLSLNYVPRSDPPFRIELSQNDITDSLDREFWSPDIAGLLNRASSPHRLSVFCRFTEGRWEPYPFGASALLDSFWRKYGAPIGIVAYVQTEECRTSNDTYGSFWRFAIGESQHFLLSPFDFSPGDAGVLEERFTSGADCRGLLITMRWNEGLRRFELARELPESQPDNLRHYLAAYPGIRLPFDDRNLRWKSLFHPEDLVMVEYKSYGYIVYLDEDKRIEGFPETVEFKVTEEKRLQYDFEAEVSFWSASSCRVIGKPAYTPSFSFGTRDKQKLLDSILNLARGDIIELKGIKGLPKFELGQNLAFCTSSLNALVKVKAHSLSMQPFAPVKTKIDPASGRLAEVTNVVWRKLDVEPIVDSADLPEGELPEKLEGILTKIPNLRSAKTSCIVFWRLLNGKFWPKLVNIYNWAKFGKAIGYKIVGTRYRLEDGGWSWRIYRPDIMAQALWRAAADESGGHGIYVGSVRFYEEKAGRFSRKDLHLAEAAPGVFRVLDPPPRTEPYSRWIDGTYVPGISEETRLRYYEAKGGHANIKWGESWLPVIMKQDYSDVSNQTFVQVRKIDISVNPISASPVISSVKDYVAEGYYSISPNFTLSVSDREHGDQASEAKRMAEALRRALHGEPVVDAEIRDRVAYLKRLKVPVTRDLRDLEQQWPWTSRIKLVEENPGLISFVEYDNRMESRVFLYEDAGNYVVASCRLVPPMTLDEYASKQGVKNLCSGSEKLCTLKRPLYYVGPRKEGKSQLFEWGYGLTLEVPEEALKFEGKDFSKAGLAVWHGDKVKKVIFKDAGNQNLKYEMDIVEIEEFYESHELYRQSKDRVLHQLKLVWEDRRLTVRSVEGLERRKERGPDKSSRTFDRLPIALSEETRETLQARIVKLAGEEKYPFSILGQLEADETLKEHGERIVYRYVPPFMEEIPENSVVLLTAKGVSERATDLILELGYPSDESFPYLDASDPFNQLEHVVLLRRQFSARQDRLLQVADKIEETLIPVSVRKPELGYTNPRAVIIDEEIMVPFRHPKLVEHLLKTSDVFALVAADFSIGDSYLFLEISPSVFVKINLAEEPDRYLFQLDDPSLLKGDKILLHRARNGVITVRIAAAGHRSFIHSQLRPVVLLPHTPLLWPFKGSNRRDGVLIGTVEATLQGQFLYTNRAVASVGGLPDVEAIPDVEAMPDGQGAKMFQEWMMRRHPKIAMVKKDPDKEVWARKRIRYLPVITQRPANWLVGHLDIYCASPAVKIKELELTAARAPRICSIDWQEVTFCDEPAQKLRKRIETSKWTYHDRVTGYWMASTVNGEERFFIKRQDISNEPFTPATGPLFFQVREKGVRLRYTGDVFWKFSFPVDELLNDLRNRPSKEKTYTVAHADSSGLIVEISPGRIAELPGTMCRGKITRNSRPISLDNIEWEVFAPGDRIRLRLTAGDTAKDGNFSLERFLVLDHYFGPRRSLSAGQGCCFLPILRHDPDEGCNVLGGGRFILTLPANWPFAGNVAYQRGESIFLTAIDPKPIPGDVVLLELTSNGRFKIAGFPEYQPQPDNREKREGDDNADILKSIMRKNNYLREFLHAVGNFIPVTVASVEEHALVFDTSDRRLAVRLSPGKICEAVICGWLPSLQMAVLRIGSQFRVARIDELVSGLPGGHHPEIAASMIEAATTVWVRCDEEGYIHYELSAAERSNDSLKFEKATHAIKLSGTDGETPLYGVICRDTGSGGLFWLSMLQATLAGELSFSEWRDVLDHETMSTMKARLLEDRSISLVKVNSVDRAFRMYRLGREMPVHVIIPEKMPGTGCLAWSENLKAIVRVIDFDDFGNDRNVLVEVVERLETEDSLTLTVTPRGKRRWWVNLPGAQQGPKELVSAIDDMTLHPVKRNALRQAASIPMDIPNNLDDALEKITDLAARDNFAAKSKAATLLRYLGVSSLCGLHLEILDTYWKNNHDNIARKDGEWRRLNRMLDEVEAAAAAGGLNSTQLRNLKEVLRAVELKTIIPESAEPPAILPLAAALAVAAGIRLDPNLFYLMSRRCEILNEVISFARGYPECNKSMMIGLLYEHQRKIESLRNKLQANRLGIKTCQILSR